MSTDPSDPWRSIPDFLNLSGTDLERVCHCPHMEDVGTSLSSHQMETTYPASTLADPIGPGSISTPLPSPELGAPHSTILSTDESPRDLNAGSESFCSDPRPSPATPETDKIDPSFSARDRLQTSLPSSDRVYLVSTVWICVSVPIEHALGTT